MPKQYEQFKKDWDAVKKAAVSGSQEVKKHGQVLGHLAQVITEGTKEVGLRIQELKDGGATGTALKDFMSDGQVKKMSDELNHLIGSVDKELQRINAVSAKQFQPTKKQYDTLLRELKAEIAARKKQVSTKLGTGNKSLKDMEKLLVEVDTLEKQPALAAVMFFAPETIADHKQQLESQLKRQIASTKDVKLTALQAEMDEQAMEGRNRKRNLAQAKGLAEQVVSECKKAQAALRQGNQNELMRVKAVVPKPMKQLDELAQKYERGIKDNWVRTKIQDSKDKAAILADIKAIIDMRNAARTELTKIANARLNA
jgi:hypothetical protein